MSTGCVLVCVMRLCSARDVPSSVIWEINEGTADVVPHRAAKALFSLVNLEKRRSQADPPGFTLRSGGVCVVFVLRQTAKPSSFII